MPKEITSNRKSKGRVIAGEDIAFVKFEKEGDSVDGIFRGTKEGQFGLVVILESSGKIVHLPSSKVIIDTVPLMVIGNRYSFEFTGFEKSKAGHEYKKFRICEE